MDTLLMEPAFMAPWFFCFTDYHFQSPLMVSNLLPNLISTLHTSLLNSRHFPDNTFCMSNGHVKLKILKTDISPKVDGNLSYSSQKTCSHFLFLVSSHLMSNSSENHGGYNFKAYAESDHFSPSCLLPHLSEVKDSCNVLPRLFLHLPS